MSDLSQPTLWRMLGKFAPAISLVAVAGLFYIIAPDRPLSIQDARTVLMHTVIVALAGLGMTIVMIGGGIDLSVGSAVALCSVVAAKAINAAGTTGAAVGIGVAAALGVGLLCGLYNGALVAALRLPPFIVTLGTLGFFRGMAKWLSQSSSVSAERGWLAAFVEPPPNLKWMVIAPAVWLMLAIACVCTLVLQRTVFGRRLVAIGSNREAARRAGISITRTSLIAYAACGLLVGLAGVIQFARLYGLGDSTVQVGLELKAVAAVVIGGASLSGGSASIFGTVCGALLMVLLDNRCTAVGWPNYVQELVVGHIIIVAVAIDQWRRRRTGVAT